MSASVVTPEAAGPSLSYQPFQCHICQSRFTRHENLKRHAAVHSRSPDKTSFPCDFCKITLSRRDLYHRHMKRKHADRAEGWAADGLQHNAGIRRERRQSSRLRGREGLSTSPSDTPYSPQTQQLLQEVEDTWVGRVDLPQTQQKLDHHDLNHAAVSGTKNLASTIAPTSNVAEPNHSIASWLTQELSMSDSRQTGLFEQYSTNFGQSLPLKSASLDVRYPFGDEMDPAITLQPIFTDGSPNSNSPSSFIPDGLSSKDMSYLSDNWFPSPSQTARGYQLYFTHISHFVPFLHRPTFDATEISPHLGLSMLCLAYQYGEDPDCGEQAGSGAGLSLRCFHRARVLAASEEEMSNDLLQTITLVQAYWLLQVYAMMYLCGEHSKYGLKLHSRMISLARFGGLTQSIPVESTETEDLDALWLEFIKAESHKRTLLAVHQIDALWYQLFSIPRSLSHLEIKHDLPCREELWTAISSAQWAHRQLAARGSAPLVPYSDAVRLFLSPELDIDSLPAFDLYGAINVTQFLLSSAREVSGWSTMTGRLSLERFEPLRSSLLAMERLIRPQAEKAESTHAVSCEATWAIAMIELLIWSPSHTCGIVGGSVDVFLNQSTYLALSSEPLSETTLNKAVQPHIDWFLRYLDAIFPGDSEPPWIALYAYKAFLIAWQLVRDGLPGAMLVVGVPDGDVQAANVWAKQAFQRRPQRQLSKLIISCLEMLNG